MKDSNKALKDNQKSSNELQVKVLNRSVLNGANARNVLLFKLATLSAFVVLICCGLGLVFDNKFEVFQRVSLVAGFAMLMFYFFAVRMMLVVERTGRLLSVK